MQNQGADNNSSNLVLSCSDTTYFGCRNCDTNSESSVWSFFDIAEKLIAENGSSLFVGQRILHFQRF